MTLVRYPLPHWPEQLDAHDRCLERLDDHLDADALQARREEIDRIAELGKVLPSTMKGAPPSAFTDDAALAAGSFWLSLLALFAAVVTICVVGLVAHVLSR